ncbi:MAG: RusA family crossover junction endodeoxyribonuclease [Planctomycetota bacterium]|jgi:Holliday junction resolvase RusA-like endonuclease
MRIEFEVIGKAATAGSKQAFPVHKKDGRLGVSVRDANPRSKDWKQRVASVAREAALEAGLTDLLTDAIRVVFIFEKVRSASHFGTGRNAGRLKSFAPRFPVMRPDVLKLARAVEDALTGVIWRDDAQIIDERLFKRWGKRACVRVIIEASDDSLIYACPYCKHEGHLFDFEVLGAADGNLICPSCHTEDPMIEVKSSNAAPPTA